MFESAFPGIARPETKPPTSDWEIFIPEADHRHMLVSAMSRTILPLLNPRLYDLKRPDLHLDPVQQLLADDIEAGKKVRPFCIVDGDGTLFPHPFAGSSQADLWRNYLYGYFCIREIARVADVCFHTARFPTSEKLLGKSLTRKFPFSSHGFETDLANLGSFKTPDGRENNLTVISGKLLNDRREVYNRTLGKIDPPPPIIFSLGDTQNDANQANYFHQQSGITTLHINMGEKYRKF